MVVDGGSTDGTLAIAAGFGAKVTPNWRRYSDGLGMGRDMAVRLARGSIIAFVDADNEFSSDRVLQKVANVFKQSEQVAVCNPPLISTGNRNAFCRYLSKSPAAILIPFQRGEVVEVQDSETSIAFKVSGAFPILLDNCAFVRKDALAKVGGFDYDFEVAMRLAEEGYTFVSIKGDGVYHYPADGLRQFAKKRILRLREVFQSKTKSPLSIERRPVFSSLYSPRGPVERAMWLRMLVYVALPPGSLFYARDMFSKDRDLAWLYHPVSQLLGLFIYSVALFYPLGRSTVWHFLFGKGQAN